MTMPAHTVFEVIPALEVEFTESIGTIRRGSIAELWSTQFEMTDRWTRPCCWPGL